MTEDGRSGAMAARLRAAALDAGMAPGDVAIVERAFALGLRGRRDLDAEHPDLLHGGRTALILLNDADVRDPVALAGGALLDTRTPARMPRREMVEAELGGEVAALLRSVPMPEAGDELLEALVTAPPVARLVALAERLDHARHLHLRGTEEWAAAYHATCDVYLPVAARTHPVLARRFRWWCGMFARRYLPLEGRA